MSSRPRATAVTSLALIVFVSAALLALAPLVGAAFIARAEGWHSAQPPPPPAPPGETGIEVPIPLGHIGQISFWAPNRGLLITAGTEVIPAGLYYYDGVSWHELSNVCGGADGRIAWAGPEEFWTVSDQQAGQQLGPGPGTSGRDRSLCHFARGPSGKLEVVASYAEPIGVPSSYEPMDAAACASPEDCWFGGEVLPQGPNAGAFHLHWNGHTMTPTPSLETPEPLLVDPPRPVGDIAFYKGRFYESVRPGGPVDPSESPAQPVLAHRLAEGASNPFVPLSVEGPGGEPFAYGGGEPAQLSAPRFAAGANRLWAFAGAVEGASTPVVALTLNAANQFQQVALSDPSGALRGGGIGGAAAEPGTGDAWVSVGGAVVRIATGGTVEPAVELPEPAERAAGLGPKGAAEALACPAPGDCWVATSEGWLFHLGGGYPRDEDPSFQTLIASRPKDGSIPFVPPETFPEDDSGANPRSIPPPPSPKPPASHAYPPAHEPLFSHVHVLMLKGGTLALTFTLATRSRVRLLALRRKRAVAATRRLVLAGGRHTLKLRLSPRAWPTKLDLQVRALGPVPLIPASGGEGGEHSGGGGAGPNSVLTSLHVLSGPQGFLAPAP